MNPDATIIFEETDSALTNVSPKLTLVERRLAVAIYRLLAAGQPVPIDRAAAVADIAAGDADRIVRPWSAVFRDDKDRIIGFWGLALQPMAHRLNIAGNELWAWCAWDPLFLARIVGDMDVTTHDQTTGDAITYQIGADSMIHKLSHPDSVLSFLRPDQPWDDNVMATFCHYVNHFTSPESARKWTADHPDTFVISLSDGVELAQRWVDLNFEPAVQTEGVSPS